jgi:hypothetical protein
MPHYVPAEHLGQARVFRDSVRAVDRLVDAALAVIAKPLRQRLARHPALRSETPMGVLRTWAQTVPADFRLAPSRVMHARTEFAITELRVSGSWIRDQAWGDDAGREYGLAICSLVFSVHRGELIHQWRPVVNVSLHSLGRWFERGHPCREPAALLADLTTLAQAGANGGEVHCPPRGIWKGGMIEAFDDVRRQGVKLRNVRTWVEA